MEYSKGFSLLEVLLSLALLMTTILGLLNSQIHIQSLVHQTLLFSRASNLLDKSEELYHANITTDTTDAPFALTIHQDKRSLEFEVRWFGGVQSITRTYKYFE